MNIDLTIPYDIRRETFKLDSGSRSRLRYIFTMGFIKTHLGGRDIEINKIIRYNT